MFRIHCISELKDIQATTSSYNHFFKVKDKDDFHMTFLYLSTMFYLVRKKKYDCDQDFTEGELIAISNSIYCLVREWFETQCPLRPSEKMIRDTKQIVLDKLESAQPSEFTGWIMAELLRMKPAST